MIRRTAIAALMLGPLLGLSAQPGASQGCAAIWDRALDTVSSPQNEVLARGRVLDGPEHCRVMDAVVTNGPHIRVELGSLRWRKGGFAAILTGGGGPVTIDVDLDRARIVPQTRDPWVGYVLDQQNRRNFVAARLRADWDIAAGALTIREASVDFPGDNGVAIAGRVQGLGAEILTGQVSGLAALVLRDWEITAQNTGYFDGMIMGFVLGAQDAGSDPHTVETRLRNAALGRIAHLPPGVFDAGTRDALSALARAAPLPWGRVTLRLDAGEGLPLSRFIPLGLAPDPFAAAALARAFGGARLDVAFVPAMPTP